MRISVMLLGVFVVLSSVSTTSTRESAIANAPEAQTECASTAIGDQVPPLPVFLPYRTPWDRLVVMPEEQSLVVGELLAPCFNTAPPDFELLPPTPAFVRIVPFACTCPNEARAYVVVFPRLGDRGKYNVVMAAAGCGGVVPPGGGGNQDSFTVKVKKAPQD